MANVSKQSGGEISLNQSDVKLFRECKEESIRYIMENLDGALKSPTSFIKDLVEHVYSDKGKQVLMSCMLGE